MTTSRLAIVPGRAARAIHLLVAKLCLIALAAILGPAAARAEGPYLQLVETVVDDPKYFIKGWTLTDGALTLDLYGDGSYLVKHNWSGPPASFDGNGFHISLSVVGHVKSACSPLAAGTGISGFSFEFTPDTGAPLNLVPPQNCDGATAGPNDGSNSVSVHVKPRSSLGDGEIVELKVGAFWGPGVTYKFKVSATGTPPPPPPAATLAATIECDSDTIVISALPSLNCHIVFTSWRRNTADEVVVSFPTEIDTFGNHLNGIQLNGRGSEQIFNWDAPHRWGLFVFACPSQKNTGANCYDSVTTPGIVTVPILVTQGSDTFNLVLTLNAVARGGGGGDGGQVARIGNRYIAGTFLHIESGPLQNGAVLVDWLSAQWQFEPVAGTEFVRLKNVWKPDVYIHCENGKLEAGPIRGEWLSAMWAVEAAEGTGYVRLRNRWRDQEYIHTRGGWLQVGPIEQDWWSAMWWRLQ
jgi:hypothetical protein